MEKYANFANSITNSDFMTAILTNPFVTTGYQGEEFFCDRRQETADIIRLLTNNNNVAIISPRRLGKPT